MCVGRLDILCDSVSCHGAAHITLLKFFAEESSVFSDLRVRRVPGSGASGIDDVLVDCMPKQIDYHYSLSGRLETRQRLPVMKNLETFRNLIRVDTSSLHCRTPSSPTLFVVCGESLATCPSTPMIHQSPDVSEVPSRAFAQRNEVNDHGYFEI
jgi:hypothetical protein